MDHLVDAEPHGKARILDADRRASLSHRQLYGHPPDADFRHSYDDPVDHFCPNGYSHVAGFRRCNFQDGLGELGDLVQHNYRNFGLFGAIGPVGDREIFRPRHRTLLF
ncbi:hypothetical protein ACJ41O_009731 [Fusarium nematophilum]